MRNIDRIDAREIARSDLVPGFAVLMKEKPLKYRFDEKAFFKAKDNDLMGLVEYYSTLVQKGVGWKNAVEKTYEKARETSLRGCL